MKLEGVRVLDLSLFLPGPMMTLMMADHGAEVVKIEPRGAGEPTRRIGYMQDGESVWFRNTHRGKKCLPLDLKSEKGLEIFFRLAEKADIVVEAFRPGVAARLGVDYAAVNAINPRIVYCAISAYGQTGRHTNTPAHDVAVQARAGVIALNEGLDGNPAMPGMPVADALASLTALSGALMALLRARETGRGDYLDVAMLDSVLAWTPNVTGRIFATGTPHVPKNERSWGGNAMYNIYQCKDEKWLALGGAEPKFAANLLGPLGRSDLLPLAELDPGEAQEPLRSFFRKTFRKRTLDAWTDWLADKDVAWAPVLNLKEAFEDPNVAERGMLTVDREGRKIVGSPLKFSGECASTLAPAPAYGADTDALLADLGYSVGEIAAIRRDGVV